MRRLIVIWVIIWCFPFLSSAQKNTLPRSKIYRTWVLSPGEFSIIKGMLFQVADSAVLVANSLNDYKISRKDFSTGNFILSEAYYNDIEIIKVRRYNSVPREILTFALVGASVGAIIGAIVYEPPSGSGMHFSQAECAGIGAVTGSILGVPVGGLTGLIKIKIPINGNIDTFNQNRIKLKKYSYMR